MRWHWALMNGLMAVAGSGRRLLGVVFGFPNFSASAGRRKLIAGAKGFLICLYGLCEWIIFVNYYICGFHCLLLCICEIIHEMKMVLPCAYDD
ncbi:hypothetical protein TNIN_306781 [Trichonephila inaurata madagascariensis]|uniref:Uncharacterized protein n=1 Tax=Trichonephila inaurata madagascariensis TaxID=2747483 RepID=A0A8X6X0L7_9ARAC|nr:hypothetical protein TNIN_306781 [Trichonephila inaurata madagascariensis]